MRFDDEDLITLSQAGQLVPGQRHPATIWRWANIGVAGVRLDSLEVGGVTYTSREALQAFCDDVTTAKASRRIAHCRQETSSEMKGVSGRVAPPLAGQALPR